MTCKDCICFKMCRMTDDLFFTDEIANSCDSFKDKSRFVELPCKVGDLVLVDWDTWKAKDFSVLSVRHIEHKSFIVAEIISIVITKKQKLIKLKALSETNKRQCNRYPVSSIGVTVFFTEFEEKKH